MRKIITTENSLNYDWNISTAHYEFIALNIVQRGLYYDEWPPILFFFT